MLGEQPFDEDSESLEPMFSNSLGRIVRRIEYRVDDLDLVFTSVVRAGCPAKGKGQPLPSSRGYRRFCMKNAANGYAS